MPLASMTDQQTRDWNKIVARVTGLVSEFLDKTLNGVDELQAIHITMDWGEFNEQPLVTHLHGQLPGDHGETMLKPPVGMSASMDNSMEGDARVAEQLSRVMTIHFQHLRQKMKEADGQTEESTPRAPRAPGADV